MPMVKSESVYRRTDNTMTKRNISTPLMGDDFDCLLAPVSVIIIALSLYTA
jgi:hypothetical protein